MLLWTVRVRSRLRSSRVNLVVARGGFVVVRVVRRLSMVWIPLFGPLVQSLDALVSLLGFVV